MFVPIVLLAAAAVFGWLSVFDRTSPLALALVEFESGLGFAVWPAFALAGGVLLFARLWHARRPAASPPARPLTRDAARARSVVTPGAAATEEGGASWLVAIRASARAVSDDAMGKVRFDDAAGVPISLVLNGVTREQARRRVAAYAAWLATIPAPPTARVRVVSSPDVEGPIHGLLRGELARHFPADTFHVTSTHGGADAVFAYPDPRWSG